MRASTLTAGLVSVVSLLACAAGVWAVPEGEDQLVQRGLSLDEAANKIDNELFGGPKPNRGVYDYPTPTYGGYGYPPPPPLSTPKTSISSSSGLPSLNLTSSSIMSTSLTSGSVSGPTVSSGMFDYF